MTDPLWLVLFPFCMGTAMGCWLRYAEKFPRHEAWAGGLLFGLVLMGLEVLMVAL